MPAERLPADFLFAHECPHVPISYNMIVKGNPASVRTALDSVYGALFVEGCADECILVDTGSTDEDFAEIQGLADEFPNLKVIDRRDLSVDYEPYCKEFLDPALYKEFHDYGTSGTGLMSFAEARNVALDASKNPVVFWIDSDDVLTERTPGNLRKGLNKIFTDSPIEQVFMDYRYEFGADGICTTTLRRERFFLREKYRWEGRCHETACPVESLGPSGFFEQLAAQVEHTNDRKPHRISDIRNYLILRAEFENTFAVGKTDPRTIFYLGNAARGLQRHREALSYYEYFDFRSGSPDDRFAAHYYRAGIYMDPKVKRPFDALDEYMECLKIKPFDPRAFFGVARAYAALSRFHESILWYKMGDSQKIPEDQIFSHDPTHVHYHPHVLAAHCYKELGMHDQALQAAGRAVSFRPEFVEAQNLYKGFQNHAKGGSVTNAVREVLSNIRYPSGPDGQRVAKQICDEMVAIPPELEKQGISAVEPPEGREKKPTISFYCQGIGEQWGPFSRIAGIGGSEKMVIMLSEAMQRTGRVNVNVYCDIPPQARGVHESGVNWRHFAEFDQRRERDVVVFWRLPQGPLQIPCVAKKRVVWNHDVQHGSSYTEESLSLTDFVQCQTAFHAVPLQDTVPADKLWIARNAIEPFPEGDNSRNPKRVLYCSSPDRGLITAINIFARAKAKDPELQLVVTYGVTPWARKSFARNNHRFVPDLGRDVSMDIYERTMHKALDNVDAVVLNRVGFKEMMGLMLGSGVWLYPTRFPEISCMSAMEAQAAGMVVCSTRYGALEETIDEHAFPSLPSLPEGDVPEEWYDEAAEMLLKATQVASHAAMRRKQAKIANERFSVDALANEWLEKLGLLGGSADTPGAQVGIVPPAEPSLKD